MVRRPRGALRLGAPAACLLIGSCSLFGTGPSEAELRAAQEQRDAMADRLRDAVRSVSTGIEASGRAIAQESDDFEIKRLSVWYRIRVIEAAHTARWTETPAVGWVDLWTLCVQLEEYLTEGEGRSLFGPAQQIAVDAAHAQTAMIEDYLQSSARAQDLYGEVRTRVYAFAKENPMRGYFARIGISVGGLDDEKSKGWFAWVPTLDLNPFSTVGSGIGEGAQAIEEVSRVADRFTDVVDALPQKIGWNLEMLRYDIAEDSTAKAAADAVTKIGDSAQSLAQTARDLPATVGAEVERTLTALEPRLQQFRATLAEAKDAATALDRTGATFATTGQSLEAMAAQLDTTLQTFQQTMAVLNGPDETTPPEPQGEPARPFDVLDYEQTARSIGAMAQELNATLHSLQSLIDDGQLDARVEKVGAETGAALRASIWTAAAAAALLLLLLFGLRLALARLRTRPLPPPPARSAVG